MQRRDGFERFSLGVLALVGVLLLSAPVQAQTTTSSAMPDAQIEANVLKALAGAPQLTNENIISNTVYGTVTLSGTVKDEPTRQMAETLVSKANGVKKVVDELTLVTESGAQSEPPAVMAQSDGTMPPASQGQAQEHAPDPDTYAAQHGYGAATDQNNPPNDAANEGPAPNNQPYGAPNASQPGPDGQQPYPQGDIVGSGRMPRPLLLMERR